MSRLRPRPKPLLVLVAVVALALAISACAVFKEGSLRLSQPGGIGDVRVHFELCSESGPEGCKPNTQEGQGQYLLFLSVPKGSVAPATITATPVAGGPPIVYSRNDQVAQAASEAAGSEFPWPPAGSDRVGYMSSVFTEEKGQLREWVVDADFGLPAAADGGSFGGPFGITVGSGWQAVGPGAPADRPVECYVPGSGVPEETDAGCQLNEGGKVVELGIADLKIAAPAPTKAFVGGKATFTFPFDLAATASPPTGFGLTATSSLANAKLKLSDPNFFPGALDPTTHRAPTESRPVTVTIPKTAKSGLYEVTLTATAGQGGSVSGVAKLRVSKPKLKLGGVKLNKAKGTATLSVKVPGAGTLTVSGKGLVKAKKKAKKAKKLKITVKAKGATKAQLEQLGKAKVKAKLTFKPTSGISAKKTKSITLKQS